jgi:hypothetical protein
LLGITIVSQPIPKTHLQITTFPQFITTFSNLGFQLHFIPIEAKYIVPVPLPTRAETCLRASGCDRLRSPWMISETDRFAEQKQQFGRFEMFSARLPNSEKH